MVPFVSSSLCCHTPSFFSPCTTLADWKQLWKNQGKIMVVGINLESASAAA